MIVFFLNIFFYNSAYVLSYFDFSNFDEFSQQILATVGQDLRRIAEQIQDSEERAIIRRKAEQVGAFELLIYF